MSDVFEIIDWRDNSAFNGVPATGHLRKIFHKIASLLATEIEKATDGTYEFWLPSVGDINNPEQMTRAIEIARMMSVILGNLANSLSGDRSSGQKVLRLRKLAVILKHMWQRQFDDASFAFFLSLRFERETMQEGLTLGYNLLDILEAAEKVNSNDDPFEDESVVEQELVAA